MSNICSNKGFIIESNECQCYFGYFGNDCSESVFTLYPTGWIVYSILMAIWFTLIGIVSTILFVYYLLKRNKVITTHLLTNRTIVLICLSIFGYMCGIMFSADNGGFQNRVTLWFSFMINQLTLPVIETIYIFIIFNWIEVYKIADKTFKKIENLRKLNRCSDRYEEQQMSLETVLLKAQSFNFAKKFLVILLIISYLIQIILFTLSYHHVKSLIINLISIYHFLFLGGLSLACFICGFRILKIVDPVTKKSIDYSTKIIQFQSLTLFISVNIIITIFNFIKDPTWYFIADIFARVIQSIVVGSFFFLFLHKDSSSRFCFSLKLSNNSDTEIVTSADFTDITDSTQNTSTDPSILPSSSV